MMGFTRCASTACFTQACQYIAGIPVCTDHLEELRTTFLLAPKELDRSQPEPSVTAPPPAKSLIDPSLAPLDLEAVKRLQTERRPGEVRITSRVRLTPHQGSTDPATSEDLGCVYYITSRKNAEFVKIGTTRKASARFRQLMTPTGERPRLLVAEPGGREQEHFRHQQFSHIRKAGSELFRYADEIVDHIAALRSQYPNYRDLTDVGRTFD
jgi:hypothetical protein